MSAPTSPAVGVVVPQQDLGTDTRAIVGWAREVEAQGFGFLDVFDHVLGAEVTGRPDWPGPYTHEHAFHEPFVLLAFLAGQVRLGLATGVLVLPQRQAVLVAKQAVELQNLSEGRLRLGVGIGWNPVEYQALGQSFGNRARRYDEQLEVLRRLWTEPVVELDGDHHRIDRAGLNPLPRHPIPLWLGGGSTEAVLSRVGRVGDGWVSHYLRPEELAPARATIARAAEAAGRDPSAIGVQVRIDLHGAYDHERFRRTADAWMATPGVTHVAIHLRDHPDLDDGLAVLARCADHLGLGAR